MENKKKISVSQIVFCGLFIALQVVFSRFVAINAWNTKIGFGFVPLFLAGYFLGPIYGGVVGALSDLIGSLLFPIGPYFPGFTLTAFLQGALYGLVLKKDYKENQKKKIGFIVIIDQLLLTLIVNTGWISVLYGSSFKGIFISRIPQALIMGIVEPVVMFGILKFIKRERFISNLKISKKDEKNVIEK